ELSAPVAEINTATNGIIADLLATGDFSAKAGEISVLYLASGLGPKRLILTGLGDAAKLDAEIIRRAGANSIKKARDLKVKSVALLLPDGLDAALTAEAITEGGLLALYSYNGQKKAEAPAALPEALTIYASETAPVETGVKAG